MSQGSRRSPFEHGFEPQYISSKENVISDARSRITPLELQDSSKDKEILAIKKHKASYCAKTIAWQVY